MAYYLMPPDQKPASIAPSLANEKQNGTNGTNGVNGAVQNGVTDGDNPTVVPLDIMKRFHFTFLIRHPRRGIPSFFRCTVPPLDTVTGFLNFMPNEAGYKELRVLFDYLREKKVVGPHLAGETKADEGDISVTVLDADDLLDKPYEVVEAFCKETGIDYCPEMLTWDDDENQKYVESAFEKWYGFHNDAIKSKSLTPRTAAHVS